MSNPKIIAHLWANYEKQVIPAGASTVQIQETKRAFYAGSHALLTTLVDILDQDNDVTDKDLKVMDDLYQELEAFVLSIRQTNN